MNNHSEEPDIVGDRALPPPPALGTRSRCALFLDFDGTLVDIASRPDGIRPHRDLPRLLSDLSERLEGRMAIISGRSLADLEGYIGPAEISLAGSHGGELREANGNMMEILASQVSPDVGL